MGALALAAASPSLHAAQPVESEIVRLKLRHTWTTVMSSSDYRETLLCRYTRDGVTGALCFNANFFLQCLEGERSAVNETYHRILRDPRHEHALLLRYDQISKRQFGDWSMGYLSSQAMAPDLLLQFGSNDRFDPEQLGADAALDFLLALKARSIRLREAA